MGYTQQTAITFVDDVLSKLPFKVDGIQHRCIRPRRPYLNGKTERSHRIDDEEFYRQLDGVMIAS